MSASESYSDDSTSSFESDFNEVDEYDVEVEEYESAESPTEVSHDEKGFCAEADVGAGVVPYGEEPIADEEWVKKYETNKETEKKRSAELQERLDGQIPISNWYVIQYIISIKYTNSSYYKIFFIDFKVQV